jgi:hypothetical protein
LLIPDINWNYLSSLRAEADLSVKTYINDIEADSRPLRLYPLWKWPGKNYPESLAFYVSPSQMLNEQLLSSLKEYDSSAGSFYGYERGWRGAWVVFNAVVKMARNENITVQGPAHVDQNNYAPQSVYIPSEMLSRRAGSHLETAVL